MTDTTVTTQSPAGGTPPRTEVPINPSPVTTPTPLSGQAPSRSEAGETGNQPSGRTQSRREAIQAAFDKAAKQQAQPEKRTTEPAKPTAKTEARNEARAKAEAEPLDLKKRPNDQPRGDRGQFAPRQAAPAEAQAAPDARIAPGRQDAAPQQKQLPANAPFRDAPQRMSEQARAAWADTPESVRGDIHRMHQEFGQAYQTYKADSDAMNDIRHFQQMAAEHKTTLKQALTNYVGMEQLLRRDVVSGLEQIIANLNLKADNGNKVTLRDIAHYVMTRTPEQMRQVQQGNVQQQSNQQIGALHQEIAGLKSAVEQMHTAVQFKETRSGVDVFADSHPRFDELGDIIQEEVSRGYSLEQAYARAELLRPSTQAAQTRTQSAQTRESDRSISGAPAGGALTPASNSGKKPEKAVGRREAIGNAIRRVNGR